MTVAQRRCLSTKIEATVAAESGARWRPFANRPQICLSSAGVRQPFLRLIAPLASPDCARLDESTEIGSNTLNKATDGENQESERLHPESS